MSKKQKNPVQIFISMNLQNPTIKRIVRLEELWRQKNCDWLFSVKKKKKNKN